MSRRAKVVITDLIADPLDLEHQELDDIADVVAIGATKPADLIGNIEDADAIVLWHSLNFDRDTINRLERCRLIVRGGVGIDNIDCAYARERGIDVANVPDYGSEEVADTAIAMAMAMTRGISYLNSRLRAANGPWSHELVAPLQRLRGSVFAIVGLGRIGSAAALRAKALGMNVVFYDPYLPDGYDKALGIGRAESFDQILADAFVLSFHCPLTDQTRHMVNEKTIARMPRGSYLVNTARGAIVDTAALPDAIATGQLAGAGIDVLEIEPPPDDDPLICAWRDPNHPAHDRVLINPHSAFYSIQGINDIRTKSARACRHAILGQPARNIVN